MKFALLLCLTVLMPLQSMADTPVNSHKRTSTLLNVHVMKDGSVGEIEILHSAGDDDFAICVTKRYFRKKIRFEKGQPADYWEKRSVVHVTDKTDQSCN